LHNPTIYKTTIHIKIVFAPVFALKLSGHSGYAHRQAGISTSSTTVTYIIKYTSKFIKNVSTRLKCSFRGRKVNIINASIKLSDNSLIMSRINPLKEISDL